ncbi:DUF1398 domain-containing protein [Pseudogemmobacter blasticus]|uniref:DUF1398 domain-containing protein n=1 Tax=Fuscovulum blasticum DSM 2131 TaxID=1188250 RepID=A0A2T4J4V6_FUSBL|nr:DUF1398 domain-containing protein [Fuscovulum blasticum]PTE12905.1 DUF1398 domain-containing protein [Fuscovulum blasticum DSM 2131]
MTEDQIAIARDCHAAAAENRLAFPDIFGRLGAAGFEGYLVDYRSGSARYYLTTGAGTGCAGPARQVAHGFDTAALIAAIRDAQGQVPGYTYAAFSARAAAAGCAGYLVSLPGRRVLYFARSSETHVEHFPA